jgi:HEAT repeat protein
MGIQEKRRISKLLGSSDIESVIQELRQLPPSRVINPLIGALCSNDEMVRWHAITALGPIVVALADRDMEASRVVMRRLMWSLNDESGGIGWGAPEAMGEIMACHDGLAQEYGHILVAYMREDGFFLELEMLQRGLMWGLGRLAQVRPSLLREKNAATHLLPYLDSSDTAVRGLAAWTLGLLQEKEAVPYLEKLFSDTGQVRHYFNRSFVDETVNHLAEKALANIIKEA